MVMFAEAVPPPALLVDRRIHARDYHKDGGSRPWKAITGICLHQTACLLGYRPERYDTLGAHLGVMRDGHVVHVHDFDRVVWHGNGWNAKTIGIEIDGLYEGLVGHPETVWDDPSTAVRETGMEILRAQVEATKDTIRWCASEVQRHGGEVRVLVAHRQSSKNRRNDPGEGLWKAVALPMMDELGLSDGGIGFQVGGFPIPEAWDHRARGIKY